MSAKTEPMGTRIPTGIAWQIDLVAESPVTEYDSRSEILREIVVNHFEDE